MAPSFPENVTLLVELPRQVLAQVPQPILELLLEGIQDVVDVAHSLDRLLFVLLNLAAQIKSTIRL